MRKIIHLQKYSWIIVLAALYGLFWLLSYSRTYDVTIEKIGSPAAARHIILPFLEQSETMSGPNGNFYIVKGIIKFPYLSPADRLILKTDNCPLSLKINGWPINLMNILPLKQDCNFRDDEFSIPIKKSNLEFGENYFEIVFNDTGGDYGVSIQTKSVLMKKTLIFVVPLIFIWLFIRFIGISRQDFFSFHTLIAAVILAGGVFAISLSYSKLSQTMDEPPHTATGMEWWDRGTYTYRDMHTPLARIAESAFLYLDDVTLASLDYRQTYRSNSMSEAGLILFGKNNAYVKNVTLARMGILPFYILAGCVVFIWSNNLFGKRTAFASLLLYVACPAITGHAGLATTDMAYAATFILAVFTYIKWLEKPNIFNSIFLGLASFLMLATKLSALVHFPTAIFLMTLWHFIYLRKHLREQKANVLEGFINGLFIALPCFLLLLESIYYFDNFKSFIESLHELQNKNTYGHAVWLFKPLRNHAVWYYFPVAFFYKNPIPFLFFIVVGITASFQLFKNNLNHRIFFPILAAIGVLVPSMLGNINIGSRHILPVFLLMTIPAGYGAIKMLEYRKYIIKAVAIILIAWQLVSFIKIAPDYIAYFNEFAGNHPENILLDTDLVWGQDLYRLENAVEKYDIKEIAICNFGTADLQRMIKARVLPCPSRNPSYKGWAAVDHLSRKMDPGLFWLNKYQYIPIGKSMNLYHIE